MAQNHYQWGTEIAQVEKKETKGCIYEVSGLDHMNAKMDALTQKVESLFINPMAIVAAIHPKCEISGTLRHITVECSLLAESIPYQVNYAQGNPYSNTYNPGWRNHPNFSYKNNNSIFLKTMHLKDHQVSKPKDRLSLYKLLLRNPTLKRSWKISFQLILNKVMNL